MANDSGNGSSRMNWHEKELLAALKRLVTARERLDSLDRQVGLTTATFDPDDVARLETITADLAHARQKATERFGKKWAEKAEGLELNQRLVLDRLGVDSYEEFQARRSHFEAAPTAIVDPTVLEFARRELASAEAAFLELQMVQVIEDEVEEDEDDLDEIDLTADDDDANRGSRSQSA